MTSTLLTAGSPRLVLAAETAQDLMMPRPLSLRVDATLNQAIVFLTSKGFLAAPVIDEAGRPVGVVSQTDIMLHVREQLAQAASPPQYYEQSELPSSARETPRNGAQREGKGETLVRDLMTPVVFSVAPDTPANKVIEEMLALHIHRLFVVDRAGILSGVISALDVLRHLRSEA